MRIKESNKEKLEEYESCLTTTEIMAIMSAVYPTVMEFMMEGNRDTAFQHFSKYMKGSNKRVFEKCINVVMSCIYKELFVLEKESFETVGGLLNETSLSKDVELQKMRSQLPREEMKNINNRELFKKIREAFVHNSPEDPNVLIDKDGKFHIRLKLKDGNGIFINGNGRFVFEMMNRYTQNQEEHGKYRYEVEAMNILNHIETDGIDENNVFSFVRILHEGQKETLDIYQKRTISRYINHRINFCKDLDLFNYFMSTSFTRHAPYRANTDNLFMDKIRILSILLEIKNNPNIKKQQLLNNIKFKSKELLGIQNDALEFQVDPYSYLIAPMLTSTAFMIFSDMKNEEVLQLMNDNGIDMELEEVRRIRNSLMHGRYYYNLNRGIEFYDGKKTKELEHRLTISTEKLITIFSSISKDANIIFKTEY